MAADGKAKARRERDLVSRLHGYRRTALFDAIRRRAAELETAYPSLGDLFVGTSGSILMLAKSNYPWGEYQLAFSETQQAVVTESSYQNRRGTTSTFQMRAAPEGEDTVELWRDGRAFTDAEIVRMIFDEFFPNII
jgi:hypothetical protein